MACVFGSKIIEVPDAFGHLQCPCIDGHSLNICVQILADESFLSPVDILKIRIEPSPAKLPPFTAVVEYAIDDKHDDLRSTVNLDLLARESATSKYHLTRKFKSELGISIYQYILTHRIGEAVLLLEEGRSIAEISDRTGFGSYGNFSTAFRRIKGMSPHRYRKKVLQK